MSEEFATQPQDPQEQPVNGTSATETTESPFLAINDRTVYKTPDEAKSGFLEAQNRITSLSEYEKVLREEYGVDKPSPAMVRAFLSELIQHRADAEKRAKETSPSPQTATPSGDEFAGMTPDQRQAAIKAREWFVKEAEKQGYVSKKAVDDLKAELDSIKGNLTSKEESAATAQKTEAQEKLTGWLKEGNVALDDSQRLKLENCIAAWVNAEGPDPRTNPLLARWARGGESALSLIREGTEMFLGVVKPGASLSKAPAVATSGKQKLDLMRKTAPPLPRPGQGRQPAPQQPQGKTKVDLFSTDLTEQALAIARQAMEG